MTTITVSKSRASESSIIKHISYDADKEVMIITFRIGGSKYRYENIDADLFEEIQRAASLGGFLAKNVFTNPDIKYEVIS